MSRDLVLFSCFVTYIQYECKQIRNQSRDARRTQAERAEATRGALMDAARRLFTERGYDGVGTEEIVRAAGVTRGALYHHFGGKAELLEAVYERLEAESTERVARVVLGSELRARWRRCGLGSRPSSTSAPSLSCSGSACTTHRRCWAGTAGGRSPPPTGWA